MSQGLSPSVLFNKQTWGKTTRVWVCGGTSRQTTDQEALLLRGRGCNSAGRPCGGRLRAPAKADYIRLSFRPCEDKKGVRRKRKKRESGEGKGADGPEEEQSPFGKAPCHFPSRPLHLTSSHLSPIYNLFSVRHAWPDPARVPAAHFLPALFSLSLVLTPSASPISMILSRHAFPIFLQLLLPPRLSFKKRWRMTHGYYCIRTKLGAEMKWLLLLILSSWMFYYKADTLCSRRSLCLCHWHIKIVTFFFYFQLLLLILGLSQQSHNRQPTHVD